MAKLFNVQSNTAPNIILTLEREGSPINVTGCTVDLIMNLSGTVVNTGHTGCALTTPTSGVVTYTPTAADFATAGLYNCEVRITYADTTVETLYQKFQIQVRSKLS